MKLTGKTMALIFGGLVLFGGGTAVGLAAGARDSSDKPGCASARAEAQRLERESHKADQPLPSSFTFEEQRTHDEGVNAYYALRYVMVGNPSCFDPGAVAQARLTLDTVNRTR